MENQELTNLFSTQISLSEWLEGIGHQDAADFRMEDKQKHERLALLKDVIGLPYDEPRSFPAGAVLRTTAEFAEYLEDHGSELCALRLIPLDPVLPKLRMRGKSIVNAVIWLQSQNIAPEKYRADFLPHDDNTTWATIFIVNAKGIYGEITRGLHSDLTQGHYSAHVPNTFSFDFSDWHMSRPDPQALEHLKRLTGMIKVGDDATRTRLAQALSAEFSNNFLHGYFETTFSQEFGIWFKDYNRILSRMYSHAKFDPSLAIRHPRNLVIGQAGSPGRASGRVRVIDGPLAPFQEGEILVCRMTTPDYLPLMQKAAAIVIDLGGVLSHAAIVARELGIPCITATGNATSILKEGTAVVVDADSGVVYAAP